MMETFKGSVSTDRNLETHHAAEVIATLEKAQATGLTYVVFELHPTDIALHPANLDFYQTLDEALNDWELKITGGYLPGDADFPVYYRDVNQLLAEIRQANPTLPEKQIKTIEKQRLQPPPRRRNKGRRI